MPHKRYEVEVRSFLTADEFGRIRRFLTKYASFLGRRDDETLYLRAPHDLRLRRDNHAAYVIVKEGKIHDSARREIEVSFSKDAFSELEEIF